MIAVGTGGIKPCVAAFGGDQFDLDQVSLLFYCSVTKKSLFLCHMQSEMQLLNTINPVNVKFQFVTALPNKTDYNFKNILMKSCQFYALTKVLAVVPKFVMNVVKFSGSGLAHLGLLAIF